MSNSRMEIETGRALVNGIHIYYEVHGSHEGIPLVLLHGGGSTIDSNFGRALPFLARSRRVIALEEQGHGRASDRDQPVTFEGSADDVAGLLRESENICKPIFSASATARASRYRSPSGIRSSFASWCLRLLSPGAKVRSRSCGSS